MKMEEIIEEDIYRLYDITFTETGGRVRPDYVEKKCNRFRRFLKGINFTPQSYFTFTDVVVMTSSEQKFSRASGRVLTVMAYHARETEDALKEKQKDFEKYMDAKYWKFANGLIGKNRTTIIDYKSIEIKSRDELDRLSKSLYNNTEKQLRKRVEVLNKDFEKFLEVLNNMD